MQRQHTSSFLFSNLFTYKPHSVHYLSSKLSEAALIQFSTCAHAYRVALYPISNKYLLYQLPSPYAVAYILVFLSQQNTINMFTFLNQISLLNEVVQSCLTFYDPIDCSRPTPPSVGFSRQEYWIGLPFPAPGNLPKPGIKCSPTLQADSTGEPPGNRL